MDIQQIESRSRRLPARIVEAPSIARTKRVLQKWVYVEYYPDAETALQTLKSSEDCKWVRGNRSSTKEGRKEYYSCKAGISCPAMVYLMFDLHSQEVRLFKNCEQHCHEGSRQRGLHPKIDKLIRELYSTGTTKPSEIQSALVARGLKEIQKSQLANFLQKLKRELKESFQGEEHNSFFSPGIGGSDFDESWNRNSGVDNGDEEQEMKIEYPNDANSNDSFGEQSLSEITPMQFATAEYDSPDMVNPKPSVSIEETARNVLFNFSGLTPAHTLQSGNQSEIVSSSSGKKYSCRNETAEDGACRPDEENIKDLVIQHMQTNYSNRDMLHIREELLQLRKEKSYLNLTRLASFTAGFLQDVFMDATTT